MKKNNVFLKGIKINAILGFNKIERNNKQSILISCLINTKDINIKEDIGRTINYKSLLKEIKSFISKSSYYLIETLGCDLTDHLMKKFDIKYILIKIEKNKVLKDIKKVGVIIERYTA